MIEFVSANWTYFVAGGAVFAYVFDKFHTFWNDKKKKQQAYNRTFVAIVKLFYSYQKHKNLYDEEPTFSFSDEIYCLIAKHIDTFDTDLESFKESILKESEIIPEISIESHVFFEIADRIRMFDRMSLTEPSMGEMKSEQKLMAKRAQFHSIEVVFDDFFKKMIEKVSKRADVEKEFLNKLSYFGTEEYENFEIQKNMMLKYLKSLLRQGAFSKEEFDLLSNNFLRAEE